ncbi:MAG: SCP2 sterol-binding domain-containing protein [Acidilobus sp.]|jgi:putative sterol carrier protein
MEASWWVGERMVTMDDVKGLLQQLFSRATEQVPEIKSWDKVYQFSVSGLGDFYIEIKNGSMKVVEGRHPSPIATLSASQEVFEKIMSGQLDAMKAFLGGQLKITGNVLDTVNLKRLIDAGLGKSSGL